MCPGTGNSDQDTDLVGPAGPASLRWILGTIHDLSRWRAGFLPEKGAVRRGILMGVNVRKWQGCTMEGDRPRSSSGSTETMAAAAAAAAAVMVMVGPLLIGLRLLWQPPVGERPGSVHASHIHFR